MIDCQQKNLRKLNRKEPRPQTEFCQGREELTQHDASDKSRSAPSPINQSSYPLAQTSLSNLNLRSLSHQQHISTSAQLIHEQHWRTSVDIEREAQCSGESSPPLRRRPAEPSKLPPAQRLHSSPERPHQQYSKSAAGESTMRKC